MAAVHDLTADERAALARIAVGLDAALDGLHDPAVAARGERIHRHLQPSWRALLEPFTI